MSKYVVNLERLIALNLEVEVDDPSEAVDKAREAYAAGSIDWEAARIDQTCACCLATGDGTYHVISQAEEAEAAEEAEEAEETETAEEAEEAEEAEATEEGV